MHVPKCVQNLVEGTMNMKTTLTLNATKSCQSLNIKLIIVIVGILKIILDLRLYNNIRIYLILWK